MREGGWRGPKITIKHFKSTVAKRIASKSREAMRCFIVLHDAFPRDISASTWDLIRHTCQAPSEVELLNKLEDIDEHDDEDIPYGLKDKLIQYVSYVTFLIQSSIQPMLVGDLCRFLDAACRQVSCSYLSPGKLPSVKRRCIVKKYQVKGRVLARERTFTL